MVGAGDRKVTEMERKMRVEDSRFCFNFAYLRKKAELIMTSGIEIRTEISRSSILSPKSSREASSSIHWGS